MAMPKKPKETDVTKLSDEELVKLQLSDNEWLVRMARWELRERAFAGDMSAERACNRRRLNAAARPAQ